MNITYGITLHNEHEEIVKLLSVLLENKRDSDEIIIVDDYSNSITHEAIEPFLESKGNVKLFQRALNKDFGAQKNFVISKSLGDYIFQIDADEVPHENLVLELPSILEGASFDFCQVPRINFVRGITDKKMEEWNWRKNEKGWISFPDYQPRIFKNIEQIRWVGKLHEKIVGYSMAAKLPPEERYCLYHDKTFEKQVECTKFYATIDPLTVPAEFR